MKHRKGLGLTGFGLVLLLLSGEAKGQFSNEWINYSQTYYKVPVSKTGIYKITYTDLQAAGVPLTIIDPRRINLFHRGTEQAIFVQGQSDAVFDPADFIEFYGKRNDGTLDADLYSPPSLQPHPFYNLYSDTTAYFLTWNPLPVAGKRMNSFFEPNSSGLPAESFHLEERRDLYVTEYCPGLTIQGQVQNTAFDMGEGWTGATICTVTTGCTGQQDIVIDNLLRGVTPAGNPQLEIFLAGRGDMAHLAEVYAGISSGSLQLLTTTSFIGFETKKLNLPLDWSYIGADGRMTVRVRLTPTGIRDLVSVSYISVRFPQNYDAVSSSEKHFSLQPNPGNKSFAEFANTPSGARIWDVTDVNNVGVIGTSPIPGGLTAVVPNTSSGKTLFISSVTQTAVLKKATFRLIAPSLHNYIIISHRSLMKPALGYANPVQAYSDYRASDSGGGYDTLTVAMDQLYNQFNYGETSPRAIYKFMKFMTQGGDPAFLFLIGKGLDVTKGFFRKTILLPTDLKDLVPSAGLPGSDMAFTAGLGGAPHEPDVPTGRLTASTPVQVAAYLNKVKEMEGLPYDELWRKNLLHLSGGINPGEPELFRSYVDGFKAIADGFYLGGSVETISKQSMNVELINVKDQVNSGLNLITFFGHSGVSTIDIDIGFVSDPAMGYNNAGKYTSFLINGCNAGRFFENGVTFGEDWVLTANKGAKSFIAHSSFGLSHLLNLYSNLFYSVAYGDSVFMRKGIGAIQKEVARRYLASYGSSLHSITQVQQMMLLGDPAVQLFGAPRPDYEIQDGSLAIKSLDGQPVTFQSEKFAIDFHARNFGRAQPGPLNVRVVRTLGDNTNVTYDSIFSPVLYEQDLRIIIKKGHNPNEAGFNSFVITIDGDQSITELNEANNSASLNFLIPFNGTRNLFPTPFAVVQAGQVDLLLQNTNLVSGVRSFKIEVDTASTFDSPFLKKQTLSGNITAKMPLTLLSDDSLVYYWRTKLDNPQPGESTNWTTSSFVRIINGSEGWGQVKFPQYSEGELIGLEKDPATGRLNFLETVSTVDVKTFGTAHSTPFTQVSLKINQEEFNLAHQGVQCRNNTLNLVAFDKSSTAPYAGIPLTFGDLRACGRTPKVINSFMSTELELATVNLAAWVANVKPSDSVVLFSIGDAGSASWSAGVKSQLELLGIGTSQLSGLTPGEPFVIFGKKGAAPGTSRVFETSAAPPNAQELIVNETVTGKFTEGFLISPLIGPAQGWSQLYSRFQGTTPNDEYGIDVTGIGLNGVKTLLMSNVIGNPSIAALDASVYPYLQLTLRVEDEIDQTAPQLRNWLVTFMPSPEGLLTYKGSLETETVEEGEVWTASYAFTNISPRHFTDSLLVSVDIFSTEQQSTIQKEFRIKPPVPGDTAKFDVKIPTKGLGGLNDITVFVNPRILPEIYYDNNVLAAYGRLNVEADHTGPLLDVTFDGRRISNGEVVSSSPAIVIQVIDRNPLLLKTDTLGVDLLFRRPCLDDCPFENIYFSHPDVTWQAASAEGEFQMTFHPLELTPGEYTLRASASDASGNLSGEEPYEITFLVTSSNAFVLESVFPNPSKENFSFRFLISGDTPPEDFRLDIYSSTGQPIRTFGNEQLEQLHVGSNDIHFPAVDASGSLLPTGIYLFRMSVVVDGERFTEGGRLVVLR